MGMTRCSCSPVAGTVVAALPVLYQLWASEMRSRVDIFSLATPERPAISHTVG